jgi:phage terminase large subunit
LRDTFLRKHGSRLIFTWNPRFKKDPIDAYYRGKVKPPGSIHIHTTFRDNPYFYRTEMPAQMEFSRENEVERYSHIWEGDYDENSQARIFTNVSIGRISVPDDVQPLYGLDFGFSKDPSALIKLYVLHKERIIYIAEEAFGTGITTKDMPAFLDTVTGVRQWQIIADSSSPRIIEDLRQASFNVAPSRKGPGSVNAGINWLRSYKIMISPDCDHMQEEAIRYYWKQDRMGNPLPMPASGWDHGWDAVRYACEDEMLGNGSGSVVDEFDDYIF